MKKKKKTVVQKIGMIQPIPDQKPVKSHYTGKLSWYKKLLNFIFR